jgi:hypothetical protein
VLGRIGWGGGGWGWKIGQCGVKTYERKGQQRVEFMKKKKSVRRICTVQYSVDRGVGGGRVVSCKEGARTEKSIFRRICFFRK